MPDTDIDITADATDGAAPEDDGKTGATIAHNGDGDLGSGDANDSGASMLATVSVCVGVAGVILAIFVSWILSVIAGVIALALAQLAASKHAPHPAAILAGRILGVLCIIANIALVALYIYQLMSFGVL